MKTVLMIYSSKTGDTEKMETAKSRFAGGRLTAIRWNSLMHMREFVALKKHYMSITWKRLP